MQDRLPDFTDTMHAIEFGKSADEAAVALLRNRRAESLQAFERMLELWKRHKTAARDAFNDAMRFGTRAQLDREALQAYEEVHR